MRISDWSSDVCSSDLRSCKSTGSGPALLAILRPAEWTGGDNPRMDSTCNIAAALPALAAERPDQVAIRCPGRAGRYDIALSYAQLRSEEHTSELQSLMRISYAVFCLKKKNTNRHQKQHPRIHTIQSQRARIN